MSCVFAHLLHMCLPMGQKLAKSGTSGVLTLKNASIWNYWMDFLISKLYAIAKTYSSGILWSLAHLLHIGSPKKLVIQRSCWRLYWFHYIRPSIRPSVRPTVHLSVCPASRVHSVAPTVLVGSFSYLYILSSNFRRCVKCKVACKIT